MVDITIVGFEVSVKNVSCLILSDNIQLIVRQDIVLCLQLLQFSYLFGFIVCYRKPLDIAAHDAALPLHMIETGSCCRAKAFYISLFASFYRPFFYLGKRLACL